MYLRADVMDNSESNDTNVYLAVTNELYYGNASDANIDILLSL